MTTKEDGKDEHWLVSASRQISLPLILVTTFSIASVYVTLQSKIETLEEWRENNRGLSTDVALLKDDLGDIEEDFDETREDIKDIKVLINRLLDERRTK